MSAASVSAKETEAIPWWLVLIEGIALALLGIFLVTSPGATTLVLIQFLGIYWLVAGIFRIVSMFLDHSMWGWKLFAGILGIIAGILVLQHPIWSPFVVGSTLVILLGIQGIIYGGVGIWQAFKGAGWGTGILAALSVIFGIYLLANIGQATLVLPWVIGILAIVGGGAAIFLAFRLKS